MIWGMIICKCALVSEMPVSINTLLYKVHCLSIYWRAFILSTAFIINVLEFQKSSVKICSLSSDILICKFLQLKEGLIFLIVSVAHFDFDLPISSFRNKNWLLKLLISILSLSVIINCLSLEVDIPIKEKFFKNSHPSAPAPIKKIFDSSIFFWISFPKIAIWSSYLEFFKFLSTFSPNFSIVSKKSKTSHWFIGIYFPVYLIISWETIPPKKEQRGDISALAQEAISLGISSSQSYIYENQGSFPFWLSLLFLWYNSLVFIMIWSILFLLFNSGKELFLE